MFVCGNARCKGAAKRDTRQGKAGHVDVRPSAQIVDDRRDDLPPLRNKAKVLVAAHRRLLRALVGDKVLAMVKDLEAYLVQCVFLSSVVAVAYEDRQLRLVTVRVKQAVEYYRNLEALSLEHDAFPGHWQQRDGLVESRRLRVPQGVDTGIRDVAVEEEIVRRYSEVGFTRRYRESLRVDGVGDCF